jgi:hypothetical protein
MEIINKLKCFFGFHNVEIHSKEYKFHTRFFKTCKRCDREWWFHWDSGCWFEVDK